MLSDILISLNKESKSDLILSSTAFAYGQPKASQRRRQNRLLRDEGVRASPRSFAFGRETVRGKNGGGAERCGENCSLKRNQVVINILSCPGINQPNYQHDQA